MAKKRLKLVVAQNSGEHRWLVDTAKQIAREHGNRISGCFLMVRVGPEHKNRAETIMYRSWPDSLELVGALSCRIVAFERDLLRSSSGE